MSEQQILQKHNPDADRRMFDELQKMLDAEIKKPYSKRNYDLISELTTAITDATIPKDVYEASLQRGLQLQQQAAQQSTKKEMHHKLRPLVTVCTCLLIMFISNAIAIKVTGSSILKLTYSFFENGFVFQYSTPENSGVSQPVNEHDDPYGIRAECEKQGFSPMTPQYLPIGFHQTECSTDSSNKFMYCGFTFESERASVSISFHYYYEDTNLAAQSFGIPSDRNNISELNIDGTTVVISKEDEQFTAFFIIDQIVYTLFTQNLDYAESDTILRSIFE